MDKSDHTEVTEIRIARLEIHSIREEHKPSIVENCLIDLRGAGYRCFVKGDGIQWGEYHEGTKAMVDGGVFRLDGLHVLGPTALAERDARVRAEALREAAEAWRQLRYVAVQNTNDPEEWAALIARMDAALIPADQEGNE